MPGIIHMDTENVLTCAKTIANHCITMEDSVTSLFNKINTIPWEGGGSEQFKSEANSLKIRFSTTIREGQILSARVEQEVSEWIDADQASAQSFASIGTMVAGISGGILGFFKGIADYFTSNLDKLKTIKEKEAYLQNELDKIARENGFPPVKVKIRELNDPEGKNSRGHYNHLTKTIVIDKSDVLSESYPEEKIIETLAHESRHAYQHYCVDYYEKEGKVPEGVNEESVIEWRDNFRNYVDPDDDFEGYRDQPVEIDARAYGDEYINRPI